ncbi:MAG: hypothetical protein LUE99_08150 [Bacteroides sp.]|nr:hypothetical protein [Bacteroides sp.]
MDEECSDFGTADEGAGTLLLADAPQLEEGEAELFEVIAGVLHRALQFFLTGLLLGKGFLLAGYQGFDVFFGHMYSFVGCTHFSKVLRVDNS